MGFFLLFIFIVLCIPSCYAYGWDFSFIFTLRKLYCGQNYSCVSSDTGTTLS